MGLFDRLRKRPSVPSSERQLAREQPGPMTSHESWAIVYPAAKKLDETARLISVMSGLNIDHKGRSLIWDLIFVMPRLRAKALYTLSPSDDAEDVDNSPIQITRKLMTAPESDLLREVLPVSFRDSAEVVAELTVQGVRPT